MSILQALGAHYGRLLAKGAAPPYGYSIEGVSFIIVLSREGTAVDVLDSRDLTGRAPRPSRRQVPQAVIRAVNVAPNFLWDKTAYALGVTRARNAQTPVACRRGERDAFVDLHERLLGNVDDEGLQSFLAFLRGWDPSRYAGLPHAVEMLDANVAFRLDGAGGELLHERAAAREVWERYLAEKVDSQRVCLVTGARAATTRLHPKIKGVYGAQSSGALLVSCNLDAFSSYGMAQGDNAPVSESATFGYTTALNTLLARDSGRRVRIGDTTTVFWAEAASSEATASACEDLFAALLEPPPPTDAAASARLADALTALAEGRSMSAAYPELDERTRFFVLGLAPNAARVSVRFWHEDSIGALGRRVAEHWQDLRIEPWPWKAMPAVWQLLLQTAAQGKSENIPPTLGGALMRAILTGSRYPHSLLGAVIARMRADKDINGGRVAVCRACLARDHRLDIEEEETPMSLDRENDNPAYLLGRLFAVYEGAQRAALGPNINATIKDRYFGAASATPASVFPLLERGSAAHLASLRKSDKGGLAHWFDREIDAILSGMSAAFPRSLRLEDQGRFAIGYHHQRGAARGREMSQTDTDNHHEDMA